jgi:mono/diheme cytochrome c family protein
MNSPMRNPAPAMRCAPASISMVTLVIAMIVALATIDCRAQPASAADGKAGEVLTEQKRAYLVAGCYQCHGTVGQGGVGPKLAPQPMALAAFSSFVRHSPRSMPAYDARVLSDADMKRIHDYLSSIAPSPAADQIPQLK